MIGVYYFYKKIDRRKKLDINHFISERNNGVGKFLDEEQLDEANEKLEFKIPNSMDDVLDKYNSLKELKNELKGKKVTVYDICYFAVDLDLGEEKVNEELDKIRNSEGFVRFLTKTDIEKIKNEKDEMVDGE